MTKEHFIAYLAKGLLMKLERMPAKKVKKLEKKHGLVFDDPIQEEQRHFGPRIIRTSSSSYVWR